MNPHTKASLLWSIVAVLAFLVLVQGYELLAAPGISTLVKLAVAVVVAGVAAVASYALAGWLGRSERT